MELTIRQRLVLPNILPKEANMLTIRLMRELRDALSFSEEEIAEYKLRNDTETGRVTWDGEPHPKEVPIGKTMSDMVVVQLKQIDKANKMTEDLVDLAELFGYGGGDANS